MIGWDLIIALAFIFLVSILAYRAGRRLGEGIYRSRSLLFVESLLFCIIFAWFYTGSLSWANAVSDSGVVYWSNFLPVLLSFTAGLAITAPGLNGWRRPLTVTVLCLVATLQLVLPISRPLLAPAVITSNARWQDGVCLQSHESTCGAAAAATLLSLRGVRANEQEMIEACLTSQHGTEPLGLYRGLKLASQGTGHELKVASRNPSDWIAGHELPNVALIRFSGPVRSEPIRSLLGPRGEGHAVVVLGYNEGLWQLGDPAVGRVSWTDEDFRRRFTGDAIYLSRLDN